MFPKKKKKTKLNKIALTQSKVLKNIKNYQPKVDMQEKQKNTKNLREREREREPFCCEGNYA